MRTKETYSSEKMVINYGKGAVSCAFFEICMTVVMIISSLYSKVGGYEGIVAIGLILLAIGVVFLIDGLKRKKNPGNYLMKSASAKFRWLVVLGYWSAFLGYGSFVHELTFKFSNFDFNLDDNQYHFGPCSFSITVFLILLILGLLLLRYIEANFCIDPDLEGKKGSWTAAGIGLLVSFIVTVFVLLDYYSIFFLFGKSIPILP